MAAVGTATESVETGEPMFQAAVGMGFMEHLQRNAEARGVIQKAMAGANARAAIVDSYDFSKAGTVADVRGGQGTVMATILVRNPQVRGMLLDRPAILAMAKGVLGSAGVLDRCDLVDGDFFGTIPEGADILLLNQVLHNWHDEPAQRILTNCRRALAPDGKLLVVERVLADGYDPTKDSMSDLNMLVLWAGRERTQKEYDALLARAGLRTAGVQDMPEAWSLIEAVPND